MPQLDVSDVLLDPLFVDYLRVQRRREIINDFGENSFQTEILSAYGVVVPVDPSDLDRGTDSQIDRKAIRIVTKFRLQLATPGYQADIVAWHDDHYVVIDVKDWSGYGAGFIEATAQSMDLVDAAVPRPIV